jgi:hypothetical protein
MLHFFATNIIFFTNLLVLQFFDRTDPLAYVRLTAQVVQLNSDQKLIFCDYELQIQNTSIKMMITIILHLLKN